MASDNEASCASDPNFAVICSFLDCFGKSCGIEYPHMALLQEMLENAQEVPQQLIDLHVKLLRKTRKTVTVEKWERALVKFCHTYSNQDGWELERFGYKKARVAVKLRLLKVLLEAQFDSNQRFKNEVNKLAANELRVKPLGRDKIGLVYWCQLDEECNVRVYREDLDEESWELVAKDRDGVVSLISTLSNGKAGDVVFDEEDSNSLEISEKPIIDTGQVTTSPSLDNEQKEDVESGIRIVEEQNEQNENETNKRTELVESELHSSKKNEDHMVEKQPNFANEASHKKRNESNDEESQNDDFEKEGDGEEDVGEYDITNEDNSQENTGNDNVHIPKVVTPLVFLDKNLPTERISARMLNVLNSVSINIPNFTEQREPTSVNLDTVNISYKNLEIKHTETPVLKISPIKATNINDPIKLSEDRTLELTELKVPIGITLTPVIKPTTSDGAVDSSTSFGKVGNKTNMHYMPADSKLIQNKISVQPIDKLSVNFDKQSEKSGGPKSLEKIAENLARNSGGLAVNVHGLLEQSSVTLGHKGMDLSTFPRGWETTNDSNRQLSFSGVNLLNRKSLKTELTTPSNMMQDVQQREMDLSTRKSGKSDISNSSYDARIPLRNHPMITDISKRSIISQVGFLNYEFSPSYHGSRIPSIDDRRMNNYGIHPDQSKINVMHMGSIGGISTKRTLEEDDMPRDILKRIRADVIPIANTMDKRQITSNNWKGEVDEAIEEPIMIVQGEGSGSDCDIGNPSIGDPIIEPVMHLSSEGDGQQTETGNPSNESSVDKNSEESKKDDRILSIDTQFLHETKATKPPIINDVTSSRYASNDIPGTSTTVARYDSPIIDSHSGFDTIKHKPTLGVQVFTKSTSSSVRKTSRWDVGKPEEKSQISHEVKSMVEVANIITNQSIDAATSRLADVSEISESLDITSTLDIAEKFETVENCEDLKICEINSTSAVTAISEGDTSTVRNAEATKIPKTTGTIESDQISKSIDIVSDYQKETCDIIPIDTTVSKAIENTSSKTNLPIHREMSPPRFFFGPNCLSYVDETKTADELSAEHETPMQNIESQIAEHLSTQPNLDKSVEGINSNIQAGNNDRVTQLCNKSSLIEIPAESTNSEQVEDVHISTNFENSVADAQVSNTANITNSILPKDMEGSNNLITVAEDTKIESTEKTNDFRSLSENPDIRKTLGNIDGSESTDLQPIDDEKCIENIQDSIVRHCFAIGDKNTENINEFTDKTLDHVRDLARLSPASDSAVESTNVRAPDNVNHLQEVCPYLKDGNNHSAENISCNLSEKVDGSKVAADQSGTNFSPKLVSHSNADEATTSEVQKDIVELQLTQSKDKLTGINETEEFKVHDSYLIAAELNKFSSDVDQEQNVPEQEKHVLDNCDIEAESMNQNKELLQQSVGQDVELEKPCLSKLNECGRSIPSENIFDSGMHKAVVCAAVHEDQDVKNHLPSNPKKKASNQFYHDNKNEAHEQIQKFEVCIEQKADNEAPKSDQVIAAEFNDGCVKKHSPCFSQFVDESKCKEPATKKSDEMDKSHLGTRKLSLIINNQDPKILPETVWNDKEYMVYQDAVSENQSSCEDHDSNEPMVIDDGAYDSTSSFKNCKLHNPTHENTKNSPLMSNNETLAMSNFPQTSHNENEQPIESKQAIATTIHESEAESANDAECVIHNMNQNSKTAIYREDDNISELTKLGQENNQVLQEDERQHDSEDQKSLVANYDSGDSCNHNTDDGFEHESGVCETEVADDLFKTEGKSGGPENVDQNLSNDFQSSTSNSETRKENGQIHFETKPDSNLNRGQKHQVELSLLESNIIYTNAETFPDKTTDNQPDTSKVSDKSNTIESTSLKMSAQLLPMVIDTIEHNLEIEDESKDEHVSKSVLESKERVESSIQATFESGMKSLNEFDSPENVNYKILDCSTINEKISKEELHCVDKANFYSRWLADSQKDVCKNVESRVSETWEDRTADKCAILEATVPSTVNTIITSNSQKCVEHNVSVHNVRKKIDDELPINHTAKQLNEDSSLDETDQTVTMSGLIQDSTKKDLERAGNDVDLSNHVVNYSILINPKSSDCSQNPNKQTLLNDSFETDESKSKTTINFIAEEQKAPETQLKILKEPSICIQQDLVQATIVKDKEIFQDEKKKVVEDVRKEPSKRLGDISNLDDIPPTKLKPVDVPLADSLFQPSQDNREVVIDNAKKEDSNPIIEVFTSDVKTEEITEIQSIDVKVLIAESDDSMSGNNDLFENSQDETDPLAFTEDAGTGTALSIRVKPVSELVYEGWKLDSTELPKVSRKRRNSIHESHSGDVLMRDEDDESEGTGGKRMRLRGKRSPDMDLRRSVEEKRQEVASSDEESSKKSKTISSKDSKISADDNDVTIIVDEIVDKKIRGRPRGKRKAKRNARLPGRIASVQNSNTSPSHDPAIILTDKPIVNKQTSLDETPTVQKKRKKRKMVLGLEIGRDIIDTMQPIADQDEMPVRQSRRIAQLKIKEEADRRRVEEETLCELKEKKDQDINNKKKRKKQKVESEEEVSSREVERELKTKKKRKKKERKKNLSKFDEMNPWRSSSGTCTEDDENNDEEDEEEDEIESEGSLLFKSDHEFSPESDLEKDDESQPLRRARTAQKAQSDDDEAEDEYACQKCGKVDHPEWILLCDTCDKGWHCSCLRPALMLIPEGDWFCPPCQHNLLVTKLQNSLKTFDQYMKRHENELLRKKRLAFVGISLDNVLHKNDTHRSHRTSSQDSDNDSSSSAPSSSSSGISTSDESEPVYQLRERRCANTYKFNDYDDMINAAIQDEVEAVQGAGNQGRGKDIATIVNAGKEEAQGVVLKNTPDEVKDEDDEDKKSEKESDADYKEKNYGTRDEDDEDDYLKVSAKKTFSRKKHRKLNSLDISSEDDADSDEDFKGTSSDEEDDAEDQGSSSEDSFTDSRRRGRGSAAPVRRSTRARMTRYDEDFINDDSDDSDRPKWKKSRSVWDDSDSEESDDSWTQRKKRSRTILTPKSRSSAKLRGKKKKKKRIIESDNHSENDEELDQNFEKIVVSTETTKLEINSKVTENTSNDRAPIINQDENKIKGKTEDNSLEKFKENNLGPSIAEHQKIVKNKENTPKLKKSPPIRRKIVYGGLQDDYPKQEEETLRRRTRGRKINYQEVLASDSEEELKKALKKTEESEDEFVINDVEDPNEEAEKDSDSGDIYSPNKETTKSKGKSPKGKKSRTSKSPAAKTKTMPSDGDNSKPKRKPGPKPGSKNKPRQTKASTTAIVSIMPTSAAESLISVTPRSAGEEEDATEASLTGLGTSVLAELDEEQLDQMMMEDEEYGKRQLELAAIEIAKKKKKEEREAKKMEKARLKALEILAAERQRDPHTLDGADGEAPKKKKRGRRSKAEILAEQMRRDGAPDLFLNSVLPRTTTTSTTTVSTSSITLNVTPSLNANINANLPLFINSSVSSNVVQNLNPNLVPVSNLSTTIAQSEAQKIPKSIHPVVIGSDGHPGFNQDPGMLVKPKRKGRGKGKKTLALEAARAAESAAKAASDHIVSGLGTDSNGDMKSDDVSSTILPTTRSSTHSSGPSTSPTSVAGIQLPSPGPPTNVQPGQGYSPIPAGQQSSVITRMLQSQPVTAGGPQSFTAAAAAMGHKYFGGPNTGGSIIGVPRAGFDLQPRGRIPSPYRQTSQSAMPPHFAARSAGTPSMRMRVPGPQMYHTPHHPMDPSPSGGGPISISSRDRSSPLGPSSAMIPPAAGSPLSKGGPTPPPPPYARGAPPMARFSDSSPMGTRHQMPTFTNASATNHTMQQPSPPPNRSSGNFTPYHPPPPNYHYGAYPPPPPPPMTTTDDAAAYQGSPYPSEHFSTPAENPTPIQPPQPQSQPQTHPGEPAPTNKQFDEEGTGEFGGLVSYFSSQREDDLDS